MSLEHQQSSQKYRQKIIESELSIYDPIEIGDPNLWIPTVELETLLNEGLKGLSLTGLPLRTRSKVVKQEICRILGYPVPSAFKRTQPRFLGQRFDTYVQKSNNLQIWNEEISSTRRYVIIKVSSDDIIQRVKVVTGDILAKLDTTGTLTQKYQARLILKKEKIELVTPEDTDHLKSILIDKVKHPALFEDSPIAYPTVENLTLLKKLKGEPGYERSRKRKVRRMIGGVEESAQKIKNLRNWLAPFVRFRSFFERFESGECV